MKDLMRLLSLFRPYSIWMGIGVFVSLLSVLASITLMAASGWFIAAMGLAGIAGATIHYFTPVAIIRVCAILRTGGRYAERIVTHEATFRLIARLRVWLYDHIRRLNIETLGNSRSGDILGRLSGDIDTLERFYLGFIVPLSVAFLSTIIVVIAIGQYDAELCVITAVFMVLAGGVFPYIIFQASRGIEASLVDIEAALRVRLSENLQGMGELQIYDVQASHKAQLYDAQNQYAEIQIKLAKITAFSQNLVLLMSGLALICGIIMGVPLVINHQITPPDLALLALLLFATFESIALIPIAFQGLGRVQRAARRIFDVTDSCKSKTDIAALQKLSENFSIAFENVSFAYGKQAACALTDINFLIKPGEKIAIIGPTGSGKSTLINLILGFWKPNTGKITFGGIDAADFDVEDIRAHFAVLPQRPYIFTRTIRENLMLANINASQADIEATCKKAGLHDFIISLPHSYDSFIGENASTLSGGQIKRLALARALLQEASCLILDEPGEGLDYTMEQDILNRVIDNLGEKSLILITHRQAGLSAMNRIIHIENGQIKDITSSSKEEPQ